MVTRAHLHFFEIVKYWKNCYDNSIAVLWSYPLVRKLIDRWNTGGPIFFLFSVRYNNQVIGLPRLNTIFGSTTAIVTKYIFLLFENSWDRYSIITITWADPPTRIIQWYCDLGDQEWITHSEPIGLKVVQRYLNNIFFISRVLRTSPQIIFFGHTVCFMINMQRIIMPNMMHFAEI